MYSMRRLVISEEDIRQTGYSLHPSVGRRTGYVHRECQVGVRLCHHTESSLPRLHNLAERIDPGNTS